MYDAIPTFPTKLPGELWGVITHFNPVGYRGKIENLRRCVERARAQGLRVMVVELAFDDDPFQVPEELCEHVERRRTHTVLWQKERLLNIGLSQLPASCDKVAWIDGDVLFESAP